MEDNGFYTDAYMVGGLMLQYQNIKQCLGESAEVWLIVGEPEPTISPGTSHYSLFSTPSLLDNMFHEGRTWDNFAPCFISYYLLKITHLINV